MNTAIPAHRRAKEFLRLRAIKFSRTLLELGSRPYVLTEAGTVIVAPHQDDETLACGGLIARKRNEGLPVHVIFITDGSASHPGHSQFDPPAIAALRRGEAMRALGCLGVERTAVKFFNEPDGSLNAITPERRENLVARLAAQLTALAPGEIFLPARPDGSSEHDAAFGFVIDALVRTGLRPVLWQYPIWAWWNPQQLLRQWLATRDCRRLRVGDFNPAKQRALQCYQSQIAPLAPDTTAALPAGLVAILHSDTEFFFRYDPPQT